MREFTGYMAGANLGHWISQYGRQSEKYWDTYITEPDIARMKSWGMDHVRVPVDYMLFESEDAPGVYSETRLGYIDRVLSWCQKNGMNMILDLHHAPGFFFGNGGRNDLFTSRAQADRFLSIWKMFARRYVSVGDGLVFELLNELVWENSDPWNALWQEAVEEILAISPARRIIVGGNYWNSVGELKNLVISPHEQVIYTFHFYEPFLFTHQQTPWTQEKDQPPVGYPVTADALRTRFGDDLPDLLRADPPLGRDFLASLLSPAFSFAETTGRTLYCGEYGVYYPANRDDALRWYGDLLSLLREHHIGHAIWSYRGFAALTSPDDITFDRDLAALVSRP